MTAQLLKSTILDPFSMSHFEVNIQYTTSANGMFEEIDWYELEGLEVSREDLVDHFGEEEVVILEQEVGLDIT